MLALCSAYFRKHGRELLTPLAGGDKNSQPKDINAELLANPVHHEETVAALDAGARHGATYVGAQHVVRPGAVDRGIGGQNTTGVGTLI
jgi:hypothetical protein